MSEFTGEVHPFADRFPMLPDDQLQELADDIKESGQLHPILLTPDGVLVDGRNRLAACELAGIEPVFAVVDDDPVAVIVSANVQRRQMTKGQQAVAHAMGMVAQGKRRNGRWVHKAVEEATENIPKESGFSEDYLRFAGVVLDFDAANGTDYAGDILDGGMSLVDSYKDVMKARRANQDADDAVEAVKRKAAENRRRLSLLAEDAPDLAELVRDERLTLEEAEASLRQRREQERAAAIENAAAWNEARNALGTVYQWLTSGRKPPSETTEEQQAVANFGDRLDEVINLWRGIE